MKVFFNVLVVRWKWRKFFFVSSFRFQVLPAKAGDCFASSLSLVSYFDFAFLWNDKTETATDDWIMLTDYCSPSPDCNGKPCEVLLYFFLAKKSDQRKLFFGLRKKQQDEQAWNGKREIASEKCCFNITYIYCVGFCNLIYLQSIKI